MPKISTASAVFLAAALAWNAAPVAAADITYQGSDTEGDVSVSYTITTDGTLGLLSLSNIVSSSATFTGNASSGLYSFGPLTGLDYLYFTNTNTGGVSPVRATASSLLFNFAGGGGLNIALGSSAPAGLEGLLFALAGAESSDDDSVVFHNGSLPDREIDNVNAPDYYFYLAPGTYTLVAATEQVFATAAAVAVPEPASWSLLALGIAGMSLAAVNRRRGISKRH